MKLLLLSILIISTFQNSKQQTENNNIIDDGASTSRQDIARCRQCEISNYANELVRLMLAQDSRQEGLISMMNNRPGELDAFHDEVFSYINLVRVGTTGIRDLQVQNDRLEALTQIVQREILEIFFRTCTQHYTADIWYDYNPERRSILVHENINVNPDQCLCGQFEERNRFLNSIPSSRINRLVPQTNIDNLNDAFNTPYHIIPLELIMTFFRSWLLGTGNDDAALMRVFYNNPYRTGLCVRTLFGRLRRSMQKLILARLRRSGEVSGVNWNNIVMMAQTDDDDNFYSEIFAHARSWLGGNIFLGPANRGPHDPRFATEERNLLNTFDRDAMYLINEEIYNRLLSLYFKLRMFVNQRSQVSHFWRMTEGFSLFVLMCNIFSQPITPTRRDQWIERTFYTREQARDVYWEVNKSPHRHLRSTNKIQETTTNSTSTHLRDQWKDFVSILEFTPIEASISNETLSWDCKFSLLYSDYLFNKKHLIKDIECPECTGFDEYLYSKVSLSNEWKKCNNGKRVTGNWCGAWRNITKDSGVIVNYLEYYKNKYTASVFESDLELLVNWLFKKSELDSEKGNQKKNNVLNDQTDLPSKIICILTTFTMNILTGHNDCFSLLKSLKPMRLVKN